MSGAERVAFLFAGQGEEGPDMVSESVLRLPAVRQLLEHASACSGVGLADVVRRGGTDLARTELLQPALVSIALGLWQALQAEGAEAWAVAGHSLGELTAFAAAGCIAPERAVELACVRGACMAEAARLAPGGMIALHDASELQLAAALLLGRSADPALDVAAHNAPGMYVLSGRRAALAAVEARHATTRVPVSGPWHGRLMHEAERAWTAALADVPLSPPRCALIANRHGQPVAAGDDLRALLAGQLTRPVQWATTMRALAHAGVTRWITVGPARTLRGLCRANLGASASIVSASAPQPAAERERAS